MGRSGVRGTTVSDGKDKIGRYEIEEIVGEGTSAVVYRAHDPQIDRTVAIKVLKQDKGVDDEYLIRFQREAKSAGAISHPNIVTIYDVGSFRGAPYIAMEYVDARSLEAILAAKETFSVKQVIRIGIQLAHALDYAHRQGVIHRDIKPGNILLMDDDEMVKLTDFGVARLDGADELQKTQAGTMLGTPRYMSPEQVAGRETDGRSDLFSLGAILYELLAHRKAFDNDNLGLLMVQILQQDPPPIASNASGVPDGLQRAVAKLLHKRPEQRFQNGDQLAEMLERDLKAIEDAEDEKNRNRFLPLRLKLAALAGATLAVLFVISMGVVYKVEARVIETGVLESGGSLAKFVAVQTALPVLGQNWLPLKLFVADARERGSFEYLAVTDHRGIVQAATDEASVGKPLAPLVNSKLFSQTPDLTSSSTILPDGKPIFLFQTPILFQKTVIGRIYLGISREGTDRVLRATLLLLTALGLISVLAVTGLSYVLGAVIARRLRLLRDALTAFGGGDYDHRIPRAGSDEIGQLFLAFNQMADQIPHGTDAIKSDAAFDSGLPAALAEADCVDDATVLTS
jgi:serine/threonine-protein kinase